MTPRNAHWLIVCFLWLCDQENNGPSVFRLHWNSFLSPPFHQQNKLLGETGYFRSAQRMKEKPVGWIGMGAQNTWTSSVCLYQRVYRNNNNNKKLNLGRVSFRAEHNGTQGNITARGTGLYPDREREQVFWLHEHLRRWQTAESALSPVATEATHVPLSFRISPSHLCLEPGEAALPAGRQDMNTCTLAGMWTALHLTGSLSDNVWFRQARTWGRKSGTDSDNRTTGFTLGCLDNFIVPTVLYCIISGHLGSWTKNWYYPSFFKGFYHALQQDYYGADLQNYRERLMVTCFQSFITNCSQCPCTVLTEKRVIKIQTADVARLRCAIK